jgi:hypothetical protein
VLVDPGHRYADRPVGEGLHMPPTKPMSVAARERRTQALVRFYDYLLMMYPLTPKTATAQRTPADEDKPEIEPTDAKTT